MKGLDEIRLEKNALVNGEEAYGRIFREYGLDALEGDEQARERLSKDKKQP